MKSRFELKKAEKIGEGAEKTIYSHPENPEKVIARWHYDTKESLEQVRGRYYLTKILHLLFPKNIPDIHQIYKSGEQVAILEKKEPDTIHKKLHDSLLKFHGARGSVPRFHAANYSKLATEHSQRIYWDKQYKDFREKISRLGISVDVVAINFGYDKDGNLLYLDNSFLPWNNASDPSYDEKRLREAIDELNGADRESALKYLERLEKLREEDLQERKSNRNDK